MRTLGAAARELAARQGQDLERLRSAVLQLIERRD
jgi:hypothetical protein